MPESEGLLARLLRLFRKPSFPLDQETAPDELIPVAPLDPAFHRPGRDVMLYPILNRIVAAYGLVWYRPRLTDFLQITRIDGSERYQRQYRRMRNTYVDYLICDPHRMTPLFAVHTEKRLELLQDNRRREFMAACLKEVDLPLLILSPAAYYNLAELSQKINAVFSHAKRPPEPRSGIVGKAGPYSEYLNCPKCEQRIIIPRSAPSLYMGGRVKGVQN